MDNFFSWLESTGPAVAIAESAWIFPTMEAVHVVGLALLVGSIVTFDLHVLGIARRTRPTATLARAILPWTWTGFLLAIATGLVMFVSNATTYVDNKVFLVKMGLLIVAGLNALLFHLHPHGRRFTAVGDLTPLLRTSAAASLSLWVTLVVMGRWIGFA
jgi:uncharacterized membrane protein